MVRGRKTSQTAAVTPAMIAAGDEAPSLPASVDVHTLLVHGLSCQSTEQAGNSQHLGYSKAVALKKFPRRGCEKLR